MKLLKTTHNNITYEFRLLELVQVIEITKDDHFTYIMKRSGRLFVCNCPGFKYRHKCWHERMVKLLLMQDTLIEPWCQWAEEGGEMEYGKE